MQELVVNARRMNDLLAEISSAASEQSNGVSQVGSAVNELDRMTQQNAALVEQTAAAASALKDQAIGLAGEVDRFKLPAGD
jgi:methyl-accepting chemotaxis protein